MKTAEEMFNYYQENIAKRKISKKLMKEFTIIEDNLIKDEDIKIIFSAMYDFSFTDSHSGLFKIAITNKRLIAVRKTLFSENINIVLLKNLNDVSKTKQLGFTAITITTLKEIVNLGFANNEEAEFIYTELDKYLFMDEEKSNIEKLKEFKELLDMEIITQEEFENKKKELLSFRSIMN